MGDLMRDLAEQYGIEVGQTYKARKCPFTKARTTYPRTVVSISDSGNMVEYKSGNPRLASKTSARTSCRSFADWAGLSNRIETVPHETKKPTVASPRPMSALERIQQWPKPEDVPPVEMEGKTQTQKLMEAAKTLLANRFGGYGNSDAMRAMWNFVHDEHGRHMIPVSGYDGVLQAALRAIANPPSEKSPSEDVPPVSKIMQNAEYSQMGGDDQSPHLSLAKAYAEMIRKQQEDSLITIGRLMGLRERMAVSMWLEDARRAGATPSVLERRTCFEFSSESQSTRDRWLGFADAVLNSVKEGGLTFRAIPRVENPNELDQGQSTP